MLSLRLWINYSTLLRKLGGSEITVEYGIRLILFFFSFLFVSLSMFRYYLFYLLIKCAKAMSLLSNYGSTRIDANSFPHRTFDHFPEQKKFEVFGAFWVVSRV